MTDKEKLDKLVAEIKRQKKEVSNRIIELGNTESCRLGLFDLKKSYEELLAFFDSMQKEPTSVWHDAKEEPQTDRQILLVMKDGNKKILTHYGCSEYCINCVWVKLSEQNKWAYIDDLLKL